MWPVKKAKMRSKKDKKGPKKKKKAKMRAEIDCKNGLWW